MTADSLTEKLLSGECTTIDGIEAASQSDL